MNRPVFASTTLGGYLLLVSIMVAPVASAEGLEDVKKAFEKLMVNYCELDFIQAQARTLPPDSAKRRELEDAWYSGMDRAQARTEAERRGYNALLGRLTKAEFEQFQQYSTERRDECRKNPKAI